LKSGKWQPHVSGNEGRMSETPRHPAIVALRAIGRFIAAVVIIGYAVLDAVLFPLFRPLVRYLSAHPVFTTANQLLLKLPPYVVLLILAVPFVVLEPLKVFALYWFALGHLIQGGALLVVAHALSILTLERLYQAGRPQLFKIGWFARIMGWIERLTEKVLGKVRATAAWQWSARLLSDIRAWFRGLIQSVR